jgi:hypothetical protein
MRYHRQARIIARLRRRELGSINSRLIRNMPMKKSGESNLDLGEPDPIAVSTPISIWGLERPKNPRKRCGVKSCRKPLHVATIEVARVKKVKKRGPGRPRKNEKKKNRGKVTIGHYCPRCHIFYYLDGTPNYRMRLMLEPLK